MPWLEPLKFCLPLTFATLAQLAEQHFRKVKVPGSNPGGGFKGEG